MRAEVAVGVDDDIRGVGYIDIDRACATRRNDRRVRNHQALGRVEGRYHGQALKVYDSLQAAIADYDGEILRILAEMEKEELRGQQAPPLNNLNKAKKIKSRGRNRCARLFTE